MLIVLAHGPACALLHVSALFRIISLDRPIMLGLYLAYFSKVSFIYFIAFIVLIYVSH